MNWKLTVVVICAYGVLKKLRPVTPFVTPFLESCHKNFTNQQIYSDMYPFWTYSYLVSLVPVSIAADLLRYKPILLLEALSLCATYVLLLFGTSLTLMQLVQVVYGIASSAEVSYNSYLYAVTDPRHFKKVTSFTRASALLGKSFAFVAAQLLVAAGVDDSYMLLAQMSLAAVCLTVPIAFILPSASSRQPKKTGDTLSKEDTSEQDPLRPNDVTSYSESKDVHAMPYTPCATIAGYLGNTRQIYGNSTVLYWSVFGYVQSLWAELQLTGQFMGNGAVEAANTLLCAMAVFLVQYSSFDWKAHAEAVFLLSSVSIFLMLCGMADTNNVFVAYGLYLATSTIYHVLIAVASNLIATQLNSASYSTVFGVNSFVALVFQTVITLLIVDSRGFALDIRQQFRVYGIYFFAVTSVFAAVTMRRILSERCRSKLPAPTTEEADSGTLTECSEMSCKSNKEQS